MLSVLCVFFHTLHPLSQSANTSCKQTDLGGEKNKPSSFSLSFPLFLAASYRDLQHQTASELGLPVPPREAQTGHRGDNGGVDSPSGGGCSRASEAGSAAGPRPLRLPAAGCSPVAGSVAGWRRRATAAGWPAGSGRS